MQTESWFLTDGESVLARDLSSVTRVEDAGRSKVLTGRRYLVDARAHNCGLPSLTQSCCCCCCCCRCMFHSFLLPRLPPVGMPLFQLFRGRARSNNSPLFGAQTTRWDYVSPSSRSRAATAGRGMLKLRCPRSRREIAAVCVRSRRGAMALQTPFFRPREAESYEEPPARQCWAVVELQYAVDVENNCLNVGQRRLPNPSVWHASAGSTF